jgi:hypothetical protein
VTLAASELTSIELWEPVKLSFSLRYLTLIARAAPLSPFVKLKLHQEKPLQLYYSLMQQHAGEETGKSFLKFYLNSIEQQQQSYQ